MIILIGGASHTGKTLLALCKQYGWEYCLIDDEYSISWQREDS